MTTRATFLATAAGTAAALSVPELAVTASAAEVASSTAGMTFTTIRVNGRDQLGIRTAHGIVDVARAAKALGITDAPRTTDDVIAGRGNVGALKRIVASAPAGALLAESAVEFGPVVGAPPKILCVGLNYSAHLK
jgi:hypothetical protein